MQLVNGITTFSAAENALLDMVGLPKCSGLQDFVVVERLREFVANHHPADAIGYVNKRIIERLLQQLEVSACKA